MNNYFYVVKYLSSFAILMVLLTVMQLFTFSTSIDEEKYKQNFKDRYQVFALDLPQEINFAGEEVPLNDIDVYERMDRELLINTYWQTQTILAHKRANRWFPVIIPILQRNGIPEDFKYIPLIETGFTNATSPRGAVGFWQFMEGTAKELGLEVNNMVDERYHVEKATQAACTYFKQLHDEFGSWTMAAAAYNIGLTGLKTQVIRQKNNSYYDLLLNEETSRYVFRLLSMKEIFEHPEDYGYHIRKRDLYKQIPTYTVKVDTAVTDFALFAQSMKINYKVLKSFNPWLREAYLDNPANKMYYIQIPKEGYELSSPYFEMKGTK
jgi:membrane-bound lytic murein transglycosylase D